MIGALMTAVKRCYACGKEKELDAFNRRSRGQYQRDNICRECHKARMKKYHAKKRLENASKTV